MIVKKGDRNNKNKTALSITRCATFLQAMAKVKDNNKSVGEGRREDRRGRK